MHTRAIRSPAVGLSLFVVLSACAGTSTPAPASAPSSEPAVAQPPGDTRYPIVVRRPFSVGQKVHVVVEVRQRIESVSAADAPTASATLSQDSKIDLELAGEIEVLGLDPSGLVNLAKLKVERCFDKASGAELLTTGSVVSAERSASGLTVLVNDKPPATDMARWLAIAFPVARPGGLLGDQIMSTDVPKAIGETWEVDRGSVATDLEGEGYTASKDEIKGTVKLESKQPCGAQECLELSAKLLANVASIGAEYNVRDAGKGTLEVELKMLLPLDTKLPLYEERALLRGTFENTAAAAEGAAAGQSTTLKVQIERDRRATYTLVVQ